MAVSTGRQNKSSLRLETIADTKAGCSCYLLFIHLVDDGKRVSVIFECSCVLGVSSVFSVAWSVIDELLSNASIADCRV